MEPDEQADRLEREADRMENDSEKVGDRIEETRRDWGAKENDPAVPGAQPAREEEDSVSEEGES